MDIEKQYDKIYRYCYFRVKSRETAEDITQETFLRYFEKTDLSRTNFNLPYLYTIARNLCIDEYRKNSAESFNGFDESNDYADDKNIENEIAVSITVSNAMMQLNDDERELLLLRFVNDVPVSDIARIYDISRFAVYRRLKQAEKKFKEHYE